MSHTILFMPRFHEAILSGRKRQTIRRPRKRPINPGDLLSLRTWEESPYRSKQEVLLETECNAVRPVRIEWDHGKNGLRITVGENTLAHDEMESFAREDGFRNAKDMAAFWQTVHGLGVNFFHDESFNGIVIFWGRKS